MSMRFKYRTELRPDGIERKGPWIPIIIRGKSETVELIFLLDSGADYTVLPIEIAEILRLDLSAPPEKTQGVGGEVDTINTTAEILIKKGHEQYRFRVPVGVIAEKKSKIPPLLGRAGFFEEFDITIKERAGVVILKKLNPIPY